MRLRYTALIALILYSQLSYTQDFKSKNFQIKKLSPHVYAAIATDGGGAICNAGVVDLGNEVLVFDPFLTPDAAIELKNFIAKAIKKPVKWVVNSHSHNDHIRGTQVFSGARALLPLLSGRLLKKQNR